MDEFGKSIADTINNLIQTSKSQKATTIDVGMFVSSVKKEIVGIKIPVYAIYVSRYRDNVIVIELPFCNSCEIQLNSVEFGSEEKTADLFINKKKVRSIKLAQLDNKYMNKVAIALVDYFKRYLMLKNKFKF